MTNSTHTAPGQMLGYLFQPDRAMLLLCSCKSSESVCIELIDDLSVVGEDGVVTLREQDKSSIQADGKTFQDRSKDLWNTLMIWTLAVENKTLDLSKTKLICVTNKIISEESLIKKISFIDNDEKKINEIVKELKGIGKNASKTLKPFTKVVLNDEEILKGIIKNITIVDGQTMSVRTDELGEKLMLGDSYKDGVIEDLRGWLQTAILSQLDKGDSPSITKRTFIAAKDRIVQRHLDLRVKVQAKRYIQITDELKEETINSHFVKQLELITHPLLDSYIADAIEDFLCSVSERTRLSKIGDLSKEDFLDMEDRNRDRWKDIFGSHMTKVIGDLTDEQVGEIAFQIYDTTIRNYAARLGDFETEPFFTKGNYHKLSNELEIGWHPDWKNKLSKK